MDFRMKQGLVVVLPMQVDQSVAYFCQCGNSDRTIVKQAAVFTGIGNLTFDKKFTFLHLDSRFEDQLASHRVTDFKHCFYECCGLPGTDRVGICPASKQ